MNDLYDVDAVARLRAGVAPPDPAVLDGIRGQLLDHADRPTLITPSGGPSRRRRIGLSLSAAAAVAVGALALSALNGTWFGATGSGHGNPGQGPTALVSDHAPAASTDPTVPGPGQFLHVTTHSWDLSENSLKDRIVWLSTEGRAEQWVPSDWSQTWYWRSAYGTGHRFLADSDAAYIRANNPELLQPGTDTDQGKDGQPADVGRPPVSCSTGCDTAPGWDLPTPDWVAQLPTDPTALRASLYAAAQRLSDEANRYNKADDVDSQAFEFVSSVLSLGYVPAELESALYQVATTIPGVTGVADETNLDGAHGVGLSRLDSLQDARTDVMFDAAGGHYIGARTVVVSADWRTNHGSTGEVPLPTTDIPVGTVLSDSAVTTDITDAPSFAH